MKKFLASLLAFAMVVTGLYIVKPTDVQAATTVDKAMLGVEATVTADKVDGKYIIRFVSTVDSLNYKNVGFDLTYPDGSTETITMKRVFQKIDSSIGTLDNGAEDVFTLSPNVISKNSKYFMTTKVVVNDEAGDYTATAFCTTKDGTKVTGATKVVSVSDLQGKTVNVTVPVAFAENATLTATYGDKTAASATLVKTGEGFSIVRIQLADNAEAASLKSVTKFTVSDGTTSKDVLYRNYKTSVANGADTSWYDVNPSATEFTIATSADLYGLAKLVNDGVQSFAGKKIYLASDITVNTGDASTWSQTAPAYEWPSIGNSTNKFQGILDGCGNAISGIYVKGQVAGVGLVGYAGTGCELKNFKLVNSFLYAADPAKAGNVGLVGIADSIKISNVYSDAEVRYWGGYSAAFVGKAEGNVELDNCWYAGHLYHYSGPGTGVFLGTLNKAATVKMSNCLLTGQYTSYNGGTHSGNHSAALIGLADVAATIDIDNCVLLGTLDIHDSTPGRAAITGYINASATVSISNVYMAAAKAPETLHRVLPTGAVLTNVKKVEASVLKNLSAAEIKAFLPVLSGESTSAWTTAKDGDLILKAFQAWLYPTAPVEDEWVDEPAAPEPETHVPDTSWYKDSETEFTLTKRAQLYGLAELAKTKDFAGKTIKLGKNITLNDNINVAAWKTTAPAGKWTPIGSATTPFAGTFDGQGYKISGLYLNTTTEKSGFFGETTASAVLCNFKLVDSYMTTTAWYIGLIGYGSFAKIEKVYTNAVINSSSDYVGGFVGTVLASPSSAEQIIKNCWFDGVITETEGERGSVGGFVGGDNGSTDRPNVSFVDCLSTGSVSGTTRVGGFVGWSSWGAARNFNNCLSLATVNGGTSVGSFIGDLSTSRVPTFTSTNYTTGSVVLGAKKTSAAFTYPDTICTTENALKSASVATLFPNSTAWEAVSGSTPVLKGLK